MKTDLTTTGYSQTTKALPMAKDATVKPGSKPLDKLGAAGSGPDYKLDLSGAHSGTNPATNPLTPPSLPGVPSLPSFTSATPTSSSIPDAPSMKNRPVEPLKDEMSDVAKETIKAEEVKKVEVKDGSVRKPAIIFIKGLDLFSSPSKSEGGYAGVDRIADSVKNSQTFSWSQKDEILKEIKTIHKDQPVILVGHSLGGDTAVEVANALDSLDHQFRPVDLLITMDSIGYNNDIIPQNVRKHLNVFGERDFILNDGPHVARRHETTEVKNILSPLNHTELDDDKGIQFEVVNMIQKAVTGT